MSRLASEAARAHPEVSTGFVIFSLALNLCLIYLVSMTDSKKPQNSPAGIEWAEGCDLYIDAFINAWNELNEIASKEKEFAYRKAILNDTVTALKPLIFKRTWDINSLTLSDAIRWVFKTAKRSLTALEVRSKLTDLGYNLDQFDNPLANIHTALTRMGDTNELSKIENEGKKKAFEPTPDLKPVPEPELNAGAIAAITGRIATPEALGHPFEGSGKSAPEDCEFKPSNED